MTKSNAGNLLRRMNRSVMASAVFTTFFLCVAVSLMTSVYAEPQKGKKKRRSKKSTTFSAFLQ